MRAYFIPALMASGSFRGFAEYDPIALGHSIFSSFVDYPFNLLPARLNSLFFGFHEEVNSNAGIWADAYANFHMPGVIIFSAAAGVILVLLDRIARRRWFSLSVFAVVGPSFMLTNTSLVTVLGSQGLALCLVLVAASPVRQRLTLGPDGPLARQSWAGRSDLSSTGLVSRVVNDFAVVVRENGACLLLPRWFFVPVICRS